MIGFLETQERGKDHWYDTLQTNPSNLTQSITPQDAEVSRWEHKERVDPRDPEGCGTPVCTLIDGRPKR